MCTSNGSPVLVPSWHLINRSYMGGGERERGKGGRRDGGGEGTDNIDQSGVTFLH